METITIGIEGTIEIIMLLVLTITTAICILQSYM